MILCVGASSSCRCTSTFSLFRANSTSRSNSLRGSSAPSSKSCAWMVVITMSSMTGDWGLVVFAICLLIFLRQQELPEPVQLGFVKTLSAFVHHRQRLGERG